MLYLIFHKEVRKPKDEYEINYYVETKRNNVSIIYENLGLYSYDYRRYNIKLSCNIRNEGLIFANLIRNAEKVYSGFNQTRKLAIMSKFVIYIISKYINIPLYRLVENVEYEMNGETVHLSPHSFTNSIYNLTPKFEKIIS